ncbi:MAG: 16S rRNA (cytosine(1402)-N(4))-methyltransferase RsmH [Bacillota bacterium]
MASSDGHVEHKPVLLAECMKYLEPQDGGLYLDCTAGAGGHSTEILRLSSPNGRVVAIDADPQAVELLRVKLAEFGPRVTVVHANFAQLGAVARNFQLPMVDGILFDLGVSSVQLESAERGFSYNVDGPLDMRMDPRISVTAQQLVNELDLAELARIFREYGEERWAHRIARFIVERRARKPIISTAELASVVKDAIPASARRSGPHPAKRVFQALRIAVNRELDALKEALPVATSLLKVGGRIVVISFHSLEDRIVKTWFRQCNQLLELTKKPVTPSEREILENPRARSAKLRAAQRVLAPTEVE